MKATQDLVNDHGALHFINVAELRLLLHGEAQQHTVTTQCA